MKITGGCHCGAISYEADVDENSAVICHCTDCQILSGSAFRVVVPAKPGGFRLLTGEPKIYIKTAESGRKRAQAFCANCGTPVYSADATNSKQFGIRVGTAQQRADLPPQTQIWCRSALAWTMQIEPIAQIETQNF